MMQTLNQHPPMLNLYSLLLYCFGVHWGKKTKTSKISFQFIYFLFLEHLESEVTLNEEEERDLKY